MSEPAAQLLDAEADQILDAWCTTMMAQQGYRLDELMDRVAWMFVEALEFLVQEILESINCPIPALVAFTMYNSIDEEGECELVLIWDKNNPGALASDEVAENVRAVSFAMVPWPSREKFLSSVYSRRYYVRQLRERLIRGNGVRFAAG